MDTWQIAALVVGATIVSSAFAGLCIAAFIGLDRWWADLRRHQKDRR